MCHLVPTYAGDSIPLKHNEPVFSTAVKHAQVLYLGSNDVMAC